jgi:hypothetical protein
MKKIRLPPFLPAALVCGKLRTKHFSQTIDLIVTNLTMWTNSGIPKPKYRIRTHQMYHSPDARSKRSPKALTAFRPARWLHLAPQH